MRDKEIKRYVTGQQLGLLGGPLYTTYKVLGALKYAAVEKGEAVYWLETNDADFNEINRIHYIDSKKELRSLKWDIGSNGFSCGSIKVDEKLISILNVFFDTITQTEYTSELRESVLNFYRLGKTLGEASASLAKYLFGDFGIKIFDPSDRDFREFCKPILIREAMRTPDGEQCNLFYMDGLKRKSVFREGGSFVSREGKTVDIEKYDLVPSLKTRSICQDAYFGTTGYLAGPGEVKYLSELEPNYRFHKIKPAKVIPRMSIDLIEPDVKRNMGKLSLDITDIDVYGMDDMIRKKIKETTGFDKKEILKDAENLKSVFIDGIENLGLSTGKLKKHLDREIKGMVGLKRKSDKEKSLSATKRIEMIYKRLKPFGIKQERVFNIFYFMNLYGGRGLIKSIFNGYEDSRITMEIGNG